MNNRTLLRFAAIAITALSLASCMTPKKLVYLQDMEENSQIKLENKIEAVISPYDELDILVSCSDEEISRPFNLRTLVGTGYGNNNNNRNYLVDPNGNIQFPILGEIHAAGLTRLQLQDYIVQLLKFGGYISDPYVMVRFDNFKIFFLGENGGKSITISNERCTFLEALAMSGDLSVYTMRDKIGVIREVDGKMTMRYLDPRSSKVFNDPYFILQQNDIIVTRANASKYWRDEFNYWSSWFSITNTIATIASTVLIITQLNKLQ